MGQYFMPHLSFRRRARGWLPIGGAVTVVAAIAMVIGLRHAESADAQEPRTPAVVPIRPPAEIESPEPTSVTMRNVDFHTEDDVIMRIRRMDGTMHGKN